MADKKAKGTLPTTVEEVLEIGFNALNKYDVSDVRKMVSVLVSAGNKRLRRFTRNLYKGLATEAYDKVMEEGGFFSTRNPETGKPKNRSELYTEIVRARNFFNSRVSTVKGALEERKRRERLLWDETREERTKRIMRRAAFEEKNAKRAEEGKKPLRYKPNKAEREYEERRKKRREKGPYIPRPDGYDAGPEDDGGSYDPNEAMKNAFTMFRKFEEYYPEVMKILGSDSVIEIMGSVANNYQYASFDEMMETAKVRLENTIQEKQKWRYYYEEAPEPDIAEKFWEERRKKREAEGRG